MLVSGGVTLQIWSFRKPELATAVSPRFCLQDTGSFNRLHRCWLHRCRSIPCCCSAWEMGDTNMLITWLSNYFEHVSKRTNIHCCSLLGSFRVVLWNTKTYFGCFWYVFKQNIHHSNRLVAMSDCLPASWWYTMDTGCSCYSCGYLVCYIDPKKHKEYKQWFCITIIIKCVKYKTAHTN